MLINKQKACIINQREKFWLLSPEADRPSDTEGWERKQTCTPHRWLVLGLRYFGIYPETSSHTTCQETFGHSHLSSLSHCGLILAKSVITVRKLISSSKCDNWTKQPRILWLTCIVSTTFRHWPGNVKVTCQEMLKWHQTAKEKKKCHLYLQRLSSPVLCC